MVPKIVVSIVFLSFLSVCAMDQGEMVMEDYVPEIADGVSKLSLQPRYETLRYSGTAFEEGIRKEDLRRLALIRLTLKKFPHKIGLTDEPPRHSRIFKDFWVITNRRKNNNSQG